MNIKIAARSVFRNKRRTIITLLSIIFGCVAIIVFGGFVDYSMWGLRESTIHSRLGHLQIYKQGFSEKGGTNPLAYTILVRALELNSVPAYFSLRRHPPYTGQYRTGGRPHDRWKVWTL